VAIFLTSFRLFRRAKVITYLMAKFPRLLDATMIVIQGKGAKSILFWALVCFSR
jgi:hypothetical protein